MKSIFVISLLLLGVAIPATAQMPQEGDPAPDFAAQSTRGETIRLSDYSGKWLVLYFYPKSFTPGCTAQGCSLRDGYDAIREAGAEILGVSVDSLETQKRFKNEHRLPFELIADHDATVARAYGVSTLMGRMARRVTFIISPDGRIARVIDDVKTSSHDRQVLDSLLALQKKSD